MNSNNEIDLIIDSLGLGGAERVCCNYANILSEAGYSVRILYYKKHQNSYLKDISPSVKLKFLESKNAFSFIYKLFNLNAKPTKKVIIFNHQLSIVFYLFNKLRRHESKVISRNVNFLSKDLINRKFSIKAHVTKFLVNKVYCRMDAYIAQCQAMKDDMVNFYGIDANKISVVYNPVSSDIFPIKGGSKVYDILFVGRLSKQKGIIHLANILKQLLNENPNIKVCIIGSGHQEYIIEPLFEEFKNNITRIPSTNNVNEFYAKSKVTILTSEYEGFPNVIAESLTAGVPVVSFDCESGPREMIIDGENGYLVDCYDVDCFVRKVTDVLTAQKKLVRIEYLNSKDSTFKLLNMLDKGYF